MAVKKRTPEPEPLNEEELTFWRGCFRQALPDCLAMERSPVFCAHIAAEVADASVSEYRLRVHRSAPHNRS